MKAKETGKKDYIGFFRQINSFSKLTKHKQATGVQSGKKVMEQLNQDNVAYLSDN